MNVFSAFQVKEWKVHFHLTFEFYPPNSICNPRANTIIQIQPHYVEFVLEIKMKTFDANIFCKHSVLQCRKYQSIKFYPIFS